MKKSIWSAAALILLLPALYAVMVPSLFAAEVDWLDYEEARALKSEKPIFVFAKMRFCGTCAAMEKDVFTDPELAQLLNDDFVAVKETINFGFSRFVFDDLKDEEGNTLKFRGFPSVMVVKGDDYGLSQGYKSAGELKSLLKRALEASPNT